MNLYRPFIKYQRSKHYQHINTQETLVIRMKPSSTRHCQPIKPQEPFIKYCLCLKCLIINRHCYYEEGRR